MPISTLSENRVHQFNLNTLSLDRELETLKIDLLLLPSEIQKRAVVAAQWHTAMDRQVCFPRNIKIETLSGGKNIQDIAKGDLVLSHLGWKKVKQIVKRRYSGEMIKIETSDGKNLIATAEHPIYVNKKGWMEIQKLRKSDCLKTRENKILNIVCIQNIRFFKSYNLISKFSKFLISLSIFCRIMPVNSISLKTNIKVWKKKINTISFNLKFLGEINMQFHKTISNFFLNRCLPRILAVAGKRAKSFLILLVRTNSKFFSTVSTFNIYRRSPAFLRTIMIHSVVTINNFATSLARNICYGRELAFQTTNFISGRIRFGGREALPADRTNFSHSLAIKKYSVAFNGAKLRSSCFNLPRHYIKGSTANLTDKIFTTPFRFMITFLRTVGMFFIRSSSIKPLSTLFANKSWSLLYTGSVITFLRAKLLSRTAYRFKFFFTKLASHMDVLKKHFSRLRALCQAFSVYNLEVEDAHTFYANGILVHNCPLCNSLQGEIIPVDSPEWGRIAPPLHLGCRCMLSYITADERGVIPRLAKYKPTDPDLLARWSSKIYTDAEIREMAKKQAESKLPFHENLTQAEKDALDRYSGTAYKDMRLYMKGGAPERRALRKEWGSEWYDKIKEDSETILKLFRKYHDGQANLMIHRSLGDLDESFYIRVKAYKAGDTISIDKSMTSWTADPKIVDDFTSGTHRVKFSLRGGRKTTKELDVWKYSSQPQEKEILVSTTNFKVVEVKEVIDKKVGTKTLNIILEEI